MTYAVDIGVSFSIRLSCGGRRRRRRRRGVYNTGRGAYFRVCVCKRVYLCICVCVCVCVFECKCVTTFMPLLPISRTCLWVCDIRTLLFHNIHTYYMILYRYNIIILLLVILYLCAQRLRFVWRRWYYLKYIRGFTEYWYMSLLIRRSFYSSISTIQSFEIWFLIFLNNILEDYNNIYIFSSSWDRLY